jgi:ParB family chromosome partitioning protein
VSAGTRDLTVLKMLAKGRTVVFTANACDLLPRDVLAIAAEHGATRPDGTLDVTAAAHAALELAQRAGTTIPVREPAAPVAPRAQPTVHAAVAPGPGGQTLQQVPTARLHPDPDNPREDLGDLTELAASLAEVGMVQPIVARRAGGRWVIVAGHRRHAAAIKAGLATVPVICRTEMRPDEVLAAMLAENSHRRDLDPIEEARGLARLAAQAGGCTHGELARRIGRHQTHVSARLALLALSAEDQDAVRAGAMKLVEATAKARLNSGRVRPTRPGTAYFSAAHELAPLAKARCRRLHTRVVMMPGGVACGDCWSSVLRAAERQDIHRRSAERGACAVCDGAYGPTREDLPA